MEEIDMYLIKKWIGLHSKDWFDNWQIIDLYPSLSHNSHPMAVSSLYANIQFLNKHFITFFHVKKETVFLYEKLKETLKEAFTQYQTANYYQHTKMENDIKNLSWETEWEYFYAITHICERPLKEIMVPFDDLNWYHLSANRNKCVD